jgi:hypothetical protein
MLPLKFVWFLREIRKIRNSCSVKRVGQELPFSVHMS